MAKTVKTQRVRWRTAIQLFVAGASNSYLTGFLAGKIYQGDLKQVCHPGLNCYSCPGALLSCPIGALQAVIGSRAFHLSLYVFGFLLLVGATLGRLVCGFLCPFGWLQELVYRIPFVKKVNRFRGDKALRHVKYLLLLVLVILLPMLALNDAGEGSPTFCKYVCPAGALEAGIPLALLSPADADLPKQGTESGGGPAINALKAPTQGNLPGMPGLPQVRLIEKERGARFVTGFLFSWKMGILIVTLLLCLVVYRPFCKYLCPLGAVYGLLNPIALYRLRWSESQCVHCGACSRACKMALDPVTQQNHPECVRCGDCVNACPTDALSMGFGSRKPAGAIARPGKETL